MKLKKYPRVLIITVNPLSTTSNNGKTYASFFQDYPKGKLAQLYFHREIPDSDVCENYYKISDEDIIGNFFGKSKVLGSEVYIEASEKRLIPQNINNSLKKSSLIRFVRSLLWRLSLNFNKEGVKDWLDKFNPDIIFFCGGNANYLYSKVLQLSKKYDSKLIYYITDDYLLPYFSLNIFKILNRIWTRNSFKKICSESSLVLTIGDKMTEVYKEKYGIESKKIMNLVETKKSEELKGEFRNNDLKFVYAGGLHSNRWKTLALIGESLRRINNQGFRGNLEIYSAIKPEGKIFDEINKDGFSKYCGSLNAEEVKDVLKSADVLIHVESFDDRSKEVTYLSVSTKIPEYMASGKCILAIGPKDVASIEYLKKTNSGFVVTTMDKQDIDNTIIELFKDVDKRESFVQQAYLTLKKNHDAEVIRAEFHDYIIAISER